MATQQRELFKTEHCGETVHLKPRESAMMCPHNATPTSAAATERMKPTVPALEQAVYEYLAARGPRGATDE